jgi:hypothetical protein
MVNKFLIAILAFSLSGCALFETKKQDAPVVILPTYGDMVAIPKVQPTNLKPVTWVVLTRPELVKLLSDKNATIVLYSLDQDNLQNLTGNLDDLQRYISEQQAVIKYTTGLIDLRRETVTKDNNDPTKK